MGSIRQRSARGVVWVLLVQGISAVSRAATLVVLARVLSPDQMGLANLAKTVALLGPTIGSLGLDRALVQRGRWDRADVDTAFWAILAWGALAWGVLCLAAPWLGHFFDEPGLGPLMMLGGATLLLHALLVVPRAHLEGGLRFGRMGLAQLGGKGVPHAVLTIGSALGGLGAWSPIVGMVGAKSLYLGWLMRLSGWWPRLHFDRKTLVEMLRYGRWLVAAGVISFMIHQLDHWIVGRTLSTAALGYYSLALRAVMLPAQLVSGSVSRVAFAAFSRAQHDHAALNAAYLRIVGYLAYVNFPVMAGLAVLADPLVTVVLGPKWQPAVPCLQILCIAGATISVQAPVGGAVKALGHSGPVFWSNVSLLAVAAAALLLLAPHGVVWAAVAVLVYRAYNLLPLQVALHRITGLSVGAFFEAMLRPALLVATMAAAVWGIVWPLEAPLGKVVVGVPAGVAVYAGLLAIFAPRVVPDLLREFRGRRPASGTGDEDVEDLG